MVQKDSLIRLKQDSINIMRRELTKNEQRLVTIGKVSLGVLAGIIIAIIGILVWLWHRKNERMKTITIKIIKKSVMGVVEGLSATIAQHNPEVDFQSVWASDAEEARLDIYYREAITDLENFLARFSSSTTQKFDLQALADDFSITIVTLAAWPPRLSGVLSNQIQNYLVHAIIAGWLSDFPEMAHTDYAGMGASDLDAIKEILLKKDFNFAEAERKADDTTKEGSSSGNTSSRAADGDEKAGSTPTAEARNEDEVDKDAQSGLKGSERNQDFVSQHFHQDHVDWSGGRPPYELR